MKQSEGLERLNWWLEGECRSNNLGPLGINQFSSQRGGGGEAARRVNKLGPLVLIAGEAESHISIEPHADERTRL